MFPRAMWLPLPGAALSSQYESYPISKAYKTKQFWLQLGAMAFFPSFYLIMFSRFSMFMTDKGIDLAYATLGVSLYNVGNVLGRLLLGKLTDNLGYQESLHLLLGSLHDLRHLPADWQLCDDDPDCLYLPGRWFRRYQ